VRIVDFWTAGRDASRQKRQARILFIPSLTCEANSGCIRNCSRPQQKRKMSVEGHRPFLGRFIVTSSAGSAIELGYFSPAPKIFLWKSPDRAEKILRMRATGRGKLRMFFAPKSISNKCSTAWRCTLKVCSPQRHA
jgi:hypothetical protein